MRISRTVQVRIHVGGDLGARSEEGARGSAIGDRVRMGSGGPSPTLAAHVARMLASLEPVRPDSGEAWRGDVDVASAADSGVVAGDAACRAPSSQAVADG